MNYFERILAINVHIYYFILVIWSALKRVKTQSLEQFDQFGKKLDFIRENGQLIVE